MRAPAILALLLTACATAPLQSQPTPEDLRGSVEASQRFGRELYALDQVASRATDVMLRNVGDPQALGIAGYLALKESEVSGGSSGSFVVSFFTDANPPRILCEVRIAPDQEPAFRALNPPTAATESFAALARARRTAVAAWPSTGQPLNPVVLPGEVSGEDGILVYLLAGSASPDVAVIGKHFRTLVSDDGTSVISMTPLSKSALELPVKEESAALFVTHVVTEFPLETHVLASLLAKRRLFVRTDRGLWQVEGDVISFLGRP